MKRVCLLTGASGFFGTAFIERNAERFEILAVHNSNPVHFATQDQAFVDPLDPSREIAANENAVYGLRADISQPSEVDRMVGEVAARFGRVDVLINAAAVRGWSPLLAPGTLDDAQTVMNVNVLAPLRLCVAVARRFWLADPDANLQANRNIINVSSSAGLFVYPDLGQALYAASKAALNHITYHLASEFWDIGIRVNAVAPDSFPGRVSTGAVLDAVAAFDASDQTGRVLPLTP